MRRVLIVMSQTGGGHRSAALALARAFDYLYDNYVQVEIVDIFRNGRRTVWEKLTDLYGPITVYSPALWAVIWHVFRQKAGFEAVVRAAAPALLPKVRQILAEARPDLVVSVHPLANPLLVRARPQVNPRLPMAVVYTDLVVVHPGWRYPGFQLYTAASKPAWEEFVRHGLPPDRVILTGLPVDIRFALSRPLPAQARENLGLDPDRFTLLVVGGAEGVGKIGRVVRVARQACPDAQVLVVCGRNRVLYRRLAAQADPLMRVYGFVENIWELMAAADVILTKAGPMTIGEGLAAGKPLVFISYIPGHEEGNAAYVVEAGAGRMGLKPRELRAELERLRSDPAYRAEMTERAAELGRPGAALEMARMLGSGFLGLGVG